VQAGELIIVDFSVECGAHYADISRTFVIGQADRMSERMYSAVVEAQLAAMQTAKPGALARDVDEAART
jgi:Xaa-Pro aminopeptidase